MSDANTKPVQPPKSVRFHQLVRALAKRDGGIPTPERHPTDRLRLVAKNQLVIQLDQTLPKLQRGSKLLLSGIDVRYAKRKIKRSDVRVSVRRVSHCNPRLVLLEGDEIHLLTDAELTYSPGTDTPPPTVVSSSANDIGYSPGTDTPPPTVVSSSGSGTGSTVPIVPASFDAQLRRILAGSAGWRGYPIVAVMDTGIDFAYPGTATLPIQHNGGHPMCDTVEADYIGWDFVHDQNNPYDDNHNKHGSRIAAIISQTMNHKVRILPLKVINSQGVGTLFDIFCGFEYLLSNRLPEKPRVINASWGFYSTEVNSLLTDYVNRLNDKGMWLINAAGNRGDLSGNAPVDLNSDNRYPACYSSTLFNVLTVTTVRGHASTGYTVVENFSSAYVNTGVGSGLDDGFNEPLATGNLPSIIGSSYATPFASAHAASHYQPPADVTTRDNLLSSVQQHIVQLEPKIDHGSLVPVE